MSSGFFESLSDGTPLGINKDYVFTTDCQLSIGKKKKMSILTLNIFLIKKHLKKY